MLLPGSRLDRISTGVEDGAGMRNHLALLAALVLVIGCGDDDSSNTVADATPESASIKAAATPDLPPDVLGTWTTRLKKSDIKPSASEFNQAEPEWTLTIAVDGGVEGAPSFTLANAGIGTVISTPWEGSAEQVVISDPEACEGETEFPFDYTVEGDELVLEKSVAPDCPHPAIVAVLTAKPWTKG